MRNANPPHPRVVQLSRQFPFPCCQGSGLYGLLVGAGRWGKALVGCRSRRLQIGDWGRDWGRSGKFALYILGVLWWKKGLPPQARLDAPGTQRWDIL